MKLPALPAIVLVLVAAFFWPRATGAGALAGLVTGIAVNTFFLINPELSPIAGLHEGIYGLMANVAVFAASDRASYLSGIVINVDGGHGQRTSSFT